MAMMDNMGFLISHIRNSFITSDDTGMCELIIDCEENNNQEKDTRMSILRQSTWPGNTRAVNGKGDDDDMDGGPELDIELAHSMDILPDMDLAGHRARSGTAQRLDELKRKKHKQSKIKHIPWKEKETELQKTLEVLKFVDEIPEYFEKKRVVPEKRKPRASSLSVQLEKFAASPNNPFMEYIVFDGKASVGVPTKKIDIFLTMLPAGEREYPMTVIVLTTARVVDFIGLICCQYTMEKREPTLRETVEAYALHIAEDDGEVDADFPALDNSEPIHKFGFPKLALVQKKNIPVSPASKASITVRVNIPDRGFNTITLTTDSILMQDILEKVLIKRKLRQDSRRRYILEKQSEPGVPVDLSQPLSSYDTLDFCLVRENSRRLESDYEPAPNSATCSLIKSLNSHHYRSYIVNMYRTVRKSEVQLGISGEKVEIDPIAGGSSRFSRQQPVTYDTEIIADCSIIKTKPSGKTTFRLVFQSRHGDYGYHDFDCDGATAQEITQKVKNILEMRASPVRKDYQQSEKKRKHILNKRHTLGF